MMKAFAPRTVPAILLLLIALAIPASALAEEIRFAQSPEISPNGDRIAFSYDGDIWTVPAAGGDATRITNHVAYDAFPVWSPDGTRIAFASDRFGSMDVYVMAADGGEAERLTYQSSTAIPCDWTPDGGSILFQSRRDGAEDLFLARLDGGTPARLSGVFLEREAQADISSDGKRVVFSDNRCTTGWQRRFFRSTDAADIHVADLAGGGFRPRALVQDETQDLWPRFSPDDREIFFVSGRGGVLDIYRMPAAGGDATRITSLEKDAGWLSLAEEGGLLAFTMGFDVYTLSIDGGTPRRVPIRLATEFKENPAGERTFSGDAQEFRVSPDGRKTAVVVHGEIFVVPSEKGGRARRVTRTPWREADVEWLSDSRRVVYASDRNGSLDLYLADTKTGDEKALTSGAENDSKPLLSPDGEWIAFYRGKGEIRRMSTKSLEGGMPSTELVVSGRFLDFRFEPAPEFAWSPDSRWIAYTAYAPDYHTDIRIRDTESGADTLASFLSTHNHRPVWSPDGKYLYFTSLFQQNGDTYRVRLAEKPPIFEEDKLDSLYEEKKDEGGGGKNGKGKDEKGKGEKDEKPEADKKAVPVVIDLENIRARAEAFPDLASEESEPVFVKEGETLVFAANVMGERSYDLWSYPADEEAEEKKLSQLTTSEKGKSRLQAVDDAVWYLEGGKVKWYDVAKEKAGALSFEAEMEVDERADREQIFRESWSILADQFYDAKMHGAPWDKILEEYGAVVPHARNAIDFQTLVRLMIGELNASHLDFSRRGEDDPAREAGYLGVLLDDVMLQGGVHRVRSVLPKGPAALEDSRIEAGEYLIAVDGEPLGREASLDAFLDGKAGRRVEIEVAGDADGRGKRTVRIRPIGRRAFTDLRYDEWGMGR
ncbi:MAG: hypothetical protein EHM19_04520, partial [Candidatus Latescibacterota bacterium]